MNFLAKLLSLVAVPALDWVYSKVEAWLARIQDRKRISEANKAIRAKLAQAKTSEQKDAAIRDLINRL